MDVVWIEPEYKSHRPKPNTTKKVESIPTHINPYTEHMQYIGISVYGKLGLIVG